MNRVQSLLFIITFATTLVAQQPNSSTARATWGGFDGPPWPIGATVRSEGSLEFRVTGAANVGYTLAWAPSGTFAGAVSTLAGIVDLDLGAPIIVLLDGFFGTGASFFDAFAHTDGGGTSIWTIPLSSAALGDHGGFQVAIADATSLVGFRLTAATDLQVVENFFYVSPTGSPANPGTAALPLDSIDAAVIQADLLPSKGKVIVAQGTYFEAVTFRNGVSVEGGYDPMTWTRALGTYSIIESGATHCLANGITLHTEVRALDMRSSFAPFPEHSSIALFIHNATNDFVIDDCRFLAGNGTNGMVGTNGSVGIAGGNGNPGQNGTSNSSLGGGGGSGAASSVGSAGGSGGMGGYDNGSGQPGMRGFQSFAQIGGFGGGGSSSTGGCFMGGALAGNPGMNGANGTNGSHGAGGPTPSITTLGIVNPTGGSDGTNGSPGAGGGGGGGGGGGSGAFPCNPDRGGGGGGGGGGGTGGGRGTGGGGGGSSIAIVILNAAPTITNCVITAGNGGNGAVGGNGAFGGNGGGGGGPSGAGPDEGGDGGIGGVGGMGGTGGAGGGGAGGWSVGVYRSNAAGTVLASNVIIIGMPGSAGFGGMSPGIGFASPGTPGTAIPVL